MPTLTAHQTQYLPYPGVLQKFFQADVFVFQDDVQFVKQEYMNRNRIRTPDGWRWLTMPVRYKSTSTIAEVTPADPRWHARHRRILETFYGRSPCSDRLDELWPVVEACQEKPLGMIGFETTCHLAQMIQPEAFKRVRIVLQSTLNLTPEETATPTRRLIALCKRLGCDRYISGSGGRHYLDVDAFKANGIELVWQDYQPRPYPQQYPGWEPNLSAIDILLNVENPYEYICSPGAT